MGLTREIDVGRVHANQKSDVEYFLETAGIGLMAYGAYLVFLGFFRRPS